MILREDFQFWEYIGRASAKTVVKVFTLTLISLIALITFFLSFILIRYFEDQTLEVTILFVIPIIIFVYLVNINSRIVKIYELLTFKVDEPHNITFYNLKTIKHNENDFKKLKID